MNFIDFEIGNKSYRLRLNTRNIVALEKQLGCNPLSIFGTGDNITIPTITTMVTILHAALQQYNHGITLNDAYNLFDEYLETHNATDFITVIIDLYKASGMIPKEENEVKNA